MCDLSELSRINTALSCVNVKARQMDKLRRQIHSAVCCKLANLHCDYLEAFPRLEGKGCILDWFSCDKGVANESLRPICHYPIVHLMEFLETLCNKLDSENSELQSLLDALRKKPLPSKKKISVAGSGAVLLWETNFLPEVPEIAQQNRYFNYT